MNSGRVNVINPAKAFRGDDVTSATEGEREGEVLLQPVGRPRQSRFLLKHLMLMVFFSALAMWLAVAAFFLLGAIVLVFGLVGLVMTVVGVVVIAFQGYRARQDSLLWALAVAAERGMPLAPALYAISEQGGFFFRHRAIALGQLVEDGATLPEALDRVPGVLSREAEVLRRVGYEAGDLPGASATPRPPGRPGRRSGDTSWSAPCTSSGSCSSW